MGSKATDVSDQIALLRNRGMEFDMSEDKAKEILLDIGYYRLGFYWNPFEKNSQHHFKAGTKLSDVVCLYYVDADLRKTLLNYLHRIEINFRTKLIYFISNKHKDHPNWFADNNIVSKKFISEFEQRHYTNTFKTKNKVIARHHKKHPTQKYAPAWKTLEFFTFGTILTLYSHLKSSNDKGLICKEYGIKNPDKFHNHMVTLLRVRNLCSHGGVLFDHKTPKGISALPTLNITDRHAFSSILVLVEFYLKKISTNRSAEFHKKIHSILAHDELNENLKSIIANQMGYYFVSSDA